MESFRTIGTVQVAIDDDTSRVISFNPKDRLFRNRILQFAQELAEGSKQWQERVNKLSISDEKDEFGFPVKTKEILALDREVSESFRKSFDDVFSKGASDNLFGVGGFDEETLANFLTYVLDHANVVSTSQVEAKLGRPLKAPRKRKAASKTAKA